MLTSYGGTSISYDAIGNPTNWRNSSSMSWDARRLTNQRMNNSDWLTYTYNSSGIRTQKYYFNDVEMYGTTHDYVLDGTKIISETVTGAGNNYTLYYLYDTSGSVQGFIYNNSYYYFQKNLQGDVVRIVNSGGTVVVEYTYDAWGNVLSVTGSQANTIGQYNPFRYRSYYYDSETGFYYLQSRYYDPTVGRFLNADGIIGANGGIVGYNMFAYCVNNPVMFCDYYGYCKTMWEEGYQGPCPGPGRCSDFDYDAYYEEQLETTGTIQTTKARDDNAKTSNINTFVNDETQHVSSLEFSMWFDSLTISSEMILTNTMHNSRLNLIDELTQVVNKSSRYTSSANGVVVLIMDVSSGIDKNIQNGAGLDKIAYDAYVDTCVTGSQVLTGIGIAAMCSNPVTAAIAGIVTCFLTVAVDEGFGIRDWFKSQYEG